MRIRLAVPDAAITPAVLDTALEAVTRTNERLLADGQVPTADEGIRKGVKWKPEPPGDEHFDHAKTVMSRGHGDCDDLAPWHAASLRVTGEDPEAKAIVLKSGPKRWHAVVQRSDGSIDDPSADAGMYEYRSPIQARLRGSTNRPNIATKQVAGVWSARCDVPWRGTRFALSSHAAHPSRLHAVRRAIVGACLVGEASAAVAPEMIQRLALLDELLRGVPPHLVRQACAEYLRAHPEENVSGESVGSLFGSVFKAAKAMASPVMLMDQGLRHVPGYEKVSRMAPMFSEREALLRAGHGALGNRIPGGGGGGGFGPTVGPETHPGVAVPGERTATVVLRY